MMAFMDPTIFRSYAIVPGAPAISLDDFHLDAGVYVFCKDSIILGQSAATVNSIVAALGAASGIGISGQIGPFKQLVGVSVASTSKLASDLVVVMAPAPEAQ